MQSPGGSSAGVAVGISAGFSPLGIGTETDGSLNTPASRAALYALKVSVGSSSSQGVISISSTFDSLGGMANTVKEVAHLIDALLNENIRAGFPGGLEKFLTDSWKGIRVGVVDASLWPLPPQLLVSDEEYKEQMVTVDRSSFLSRLMLTKFRNQHQMVLLPKSKSKEHLWFIPCIYFQQAR